jgi:pSer/pThr/pTyr-binding forkhead associated (FHA) protein/CheY-like chemotaxis protein
VSAIDAPQRLRSREKGERGVAGNVARVLYVGGALALEEFADRLDADVELNAETSARDALSRLETDGDFALVVCDEDAGGMSGLALLGLVRTLAPTTVRLLSGEGSAGGVALASRGLVFRCLPRPCPSTELRRAIADALDYHQLLVTSPAQPVEARSDRVAMPPPANRELPAPRALLGGGSAGAVHFASTSPSIDLLPSDRIVLDSTAQRVGLQVVGRFVELLPGVTVVGRSRTCHIPILDPQVSRRHATFSNTGRDIAVRNVSQTNGVRVNGTLIERDLARTLKVGDRVMLGTHEIELCALGDYCPSFEPTDVLLRDETPEQGNRSTLLTLAQVAEKYFALGQVREAERVLRPMLAGLLRHCGAGSKPSPIDVSLATDLPLRIAEATRAGEWIDYVFQLFTLLERPLESESVERLYRVIPDSQGVSMTGYRAYLEVLARGADRMGPQERFRVRRIQGLATPLMMSAHV